MKLRIRLINVSHKDLQWAWGFFLHFYKLKLVNQLEGRKSVTILRYPLIKILHWIDSQCWICLIVIILTWFCIWIFLLLHDFPSIVEFYAFFRLYFLKHFTIVFKCGGGFFFWFISLCITYRKQYFHSVIRWDFF